MSQFHAVFREILDWEGSISIVATVGADGGAPRLFLPLVTFVGEQALLSAARALSFLPADLGDALLFCGSAAFDRRFDLIQQESAR